MCIENLQVSKFFVTLPLKFFEAVQDAAAAAAAEAPRNGDGRSSDAGGGLQYLKPYTAGTRGTGTGNGLRFYGGAAAAETARSRRTGRSKQNGTRGRETDAKAA